MRKVFFEIPCLTEYSKALSGEYLRKHWFHKADKRYMAQYIQKFIEYNKPFLDFLGVTPLVEGTDRNVSLRFRSSEFVGAIPLRSPDTGKQIGDFIVSPRYGTEGKFTDYIKILNLINQSIQAEFKPSIPLVSGRNFQPPFYYEALIFVKKLAQLTRNKWVKFDREEKIFDHPQGQVNWKKYIQREYKVENSLKFPVRKNILSEYHKEYGQIKYVFELCKKELLGPATPTEMKYGIKPLLHYLETKLKFHNSLKTKHFIIRHSDPPLVKEVKKQGNKIMQKEFSQAIAWRVDFNEVFEKYVQYIFMEISKELGGKFYPNYKIRQMSPTRFTWELSHLEPDGIYRKGTRLNIFVDAKYKSHLLNKFSSSDDLKSEFRKDLHQIMSYMSFSDQPAKYGFLCYPSTQVESKEIKFSYALNHTQNIIHLVGIPLDINKIDRASQLIKEKIYSLEKIKFSQILY